MEKELPHIRISTPTDSIGFTTPKSVPIKPHFPPRAREQHGSRIKRELEKAWKESENEKVASHSERTGTYIEFQNSPGFDFAIKSLEDLRQGVRLCNVREERTLRDGGEEIITRYATVFIPNDKKKVFSDKVEKYLREETAGGSPKNKNLIESIEELQKALFVESFWTDDKSLIPSSQKEWCEVWLRGEEDDVVSRFNELLQSQNIDSKSGYIKFPERFVKIIYVSEEQLGDITRNSDDIAEYRRAKTTAGFLLSQTPAEQSEWVEDLVGRLSVDDDLNVSVCILDTGVNNGHPLLSPVLSDDDCQTVESDWQSHDHDGHGTLVAGLAAYGDLQSKLEGNNQVNLKHVLESVKILPPAGESSVEFWGEITKQAVSRAEVQAKGRRRIICMPVAAEDTRDRGRPSSWSAAIDQITSGAEEEDQRLFVVAAGNITDIGQITNYPSSLWTDSIHDPAQSWNAVTVGAFTELTEITESGLHEGYPLANKGEISPFSTTSLVWENKWPIKPDIVFEGGNVETNAQKSTWYSDDLSLVSTNFKPQEELLWPFNMTSAATAQAANFAAQIQVQYPDYWPETVRALMIHSAEWPDALKKQFAINDNKTELNNVLRACGYGVPNLEKAIYCASNSLTLIAEAEIQPFEGSKTKDMHLYDLPWPKEILEGLGESNVEMRITLSYFVEPGPGEIGWKDRYRYASHALRFDLNSPEEDRELFIKRVNKQSRENENDRPDTSSPSDHWLIGSNNRDKGSIHSDIWRGTAVQLASSNLIAISPVIGWWRERKHLGKSNKMGRYSLIISITTPEQDVDIYTPVQIQLAQQIEVPIKN